jgi:hypothetical protein
MPIETKFVSEEIEKLTDYYNSLSAFWRFFLIPTLRGKALTTQTPLEIFKLANTFVFWFVSGIYNLFRANPLSFFSESRVKAWNQLQKNNLLDGDEAEANFSAIAQHQDLSSVALALNIARWANLLKKDVIQANVNAITQHPNTSKLATALYRAYQYDLFTGAAAQRNFDAISQPGQDPWTIMSVLSTAHWAGLLTGDLAEQNVNAIMQHQDIERLSSALDEAYCAGLFTKDVAQKNFNTILHHKNLLDLYWALGGANACTGTLRKKDAARLRTKDEAKMLAINAEIILQSQDPLATARSFYGDRKTTKPLASNAGIKSIENAKHETKPAKQTVPKEKDMKFFGSTSPAPPPVSKDNDNDNKPTI